MSYPFVFLLLGGLVLAAAWVPLLIRGLPLSLAIVAVAAGYVFFSVAGIDNLTGEEIAWTEQLTRIALVLAIMSTGLAIDRPFSVPRWRSVWRLLIVAMPLTLALNVVLGMATLGLPFGLALLIAAVLVPTDPVLAGEVGVGPPGSGAPSELRFALTAEAGVNDGIAYPFVTLGLLFATQKWGSGPALHWLGVDFLWETLGAAVVGVVAGRAIVVGNRFLPDHLRLQHSGSGTAALGLTLLAFGAAEALNTNGFVAVFATAVSIRNAARGTDYLRQLHAFAIDVEKVVTAIVLAVFGGAIATGIVGAITWHEAAFVFGVLLVTRPVAVLISGAGMRLSLRERLVTGYLGIRGLASLYYAVLAANALDSAPFQQRLLSIVALTVLVSAVIYGATGDYLMRWIESREAR